MNNTKDILVDSIKDLLRINKQNQSQLGEYLGMPRQSISRMLNGEREINGCI